MSAPPPVAGWFQNGFHAFLGPFLRRHFHTIAVDRQSLAGIRDLGSVPLIVYANHPSWWDPLIAHFLCRNCFQGRQFYAPIDAAALAQYQVFRKLGFSGIDLTSKRGAADFLRNSMAILDAPGTSLWMTPEGKFADCRDHSQPLMPGMAHLCTRMSSEGCAVPMALEYAFWDERLPECLVRFGTPVRPGDYPDSSKQAFNELLELRLRETQAELATQVVARVPDPFEPLLSGARGAGGFYDGFRRFRSVIMRNKFRAEHGRKFN